MRGGAPRGFRGNGVGQRVVADAGVPLIGGMAVSCSVGAVSRAWVRP